MEETVKSLSKMYGFDACEALRRLNMKSTGKAEKKSTKVPMPFCGEINENWCMGVRVNHGLYSQCTKTKDNGKEYCVACQKQIDSKGELTYGTIQERASQCKNPLDYTDKKGKRVVPYGNVMKKLNISREKVEELAKELGWNIPEEQFEVRVLKKGRPRKEKTDAPKEKKPRGRPRKQKKVVSASSETDDLVASLVEAAKKEPNTDDESESRKEFKKEVEKVGATLTPAPVAAPVAAPAPKVEPAPVAASDELEEEAEPDDEEELDVEEVTYGGVIYLEDSDKNLYDINTHEALEKKWDADQECLV